ncbi:MAG: chromosome segregation protein SMC [Propionibacteriaceae bacterium]|nr:chromosome segregation protein SMC [Propionibacteriaceae bacterium]
MYLKKLTLRGFKSFASATSLVLEPGITCIVGPNGSGKSNIVDALAWVMGEQGAKSLRGASMEDVIFAGTAKRAPLGRSEIQLTIDNSDQALPIDYAEVTIARTKFRNGSSEYSINGTACRLLDVRELLSDSGIGREMHVIVGQGHLDQILSATAETRRGFIEEAAGVLKHRERKEKALRKLDATQANLHRLTDLISEIRRQLKPLGRQAEVAKRASVVQAELRDAKARLLADDLAQAQTVLTTESDDENSARTRRGLVESALAAARESEDQARATMTSADQDHRRIQETWFVLSSVGERVRSNITVAQERVHNATDRPVIDADPARDPQTLLSQAEAISGSEAKLRDEVAVRSQKLKQASEARASAEADSMAAGEEFEQLAAAAARQRESAARLSGQVTALRARVASGAARLDQARQASERATQAVEAAATAFDEASQRGIVHEVDQDLDAEVEARRADVVSARQALDSARDHAAQATQARAGLAARVETLRLTLGSQADGVAWLEAESDLVGLRGPVASLVTVQPGYEAAVAAGLGTAAEAVTVVDLRVGAQAMELLRAGDRGRADLVVAAAADLTDSNEATSPPGAVLARSLLSGDPAVVAALSHVLGGAVVAESVEQAQQWLEQCPELVVVTRDGERLTSWLVSGGSSAGQSSLQIASALSGAEVELAGVTIEVDQTQAELASAQALLSQAQALRDETMRRRDDAVAARGAETQRLARLESALALARAEADRRLEQHARAEQDLAADQTSLSQSEATLAAVSQSQAVAAPDPTSRDRLADAAKKARAVEMEARLGLRTLEERARSLANQAESLRAAAQSEREARLEAERRRRRLEHQAEVARSAAIAGQWLYDRISQSLRLAEEARTHTGQVRDSAANEVESSRAAVRQLSSELEGLVDSVHREELAKAQQQMRVDALAQRAMAEVGLDATTLVDQYGPSQPIPVLGDDLTATEQPRTVPFVREEQLKRLRTAERDLQLLGKINPLALEEFQAMEERHQFLARQLEDVRKTRSDLLGIVDDVDARVQEVFASAYADVEREFATTFTRLFPGGEGRLVLTEPGQWLTTGVEVEARPAGKKVKRLSLLSGGERSLVAVCFLIALFKARPSPFYILDEVEAALDDTNLGRLLEIYEELRATSQLLVITHQKRTMEIADTLYGVTMGSDGTSTVVSQRLRED